MDLSQVFSAHQREIYVYVLRVLGDSSTAEDLTQDVFERAYRAALRFRGDSSVRTWLFAIAHNVLVSHMRRRRGDARPILDDDLVNSPNLGQRADIESALAALSPLAREAIVLCDVLQFSPSEAAAVLSISAGAMRVRLHRARAAFREVIGDE
jgi:RNA polymerase sigma-70 factor, ECF subfamily